MSELVPAPRKFRGEVPAAHRASLDTRLVWMWHQRFGTVQTVWQVSQRPGGDLLDYTAATLILQAIIGRDLATITQLLHRLEGGALGDDEVLDRDGEQTEIRV